MADVKKMYYENRGKILVKNLKSRHFDAYYCATREEALEKALELIPEGSTVGWGGAMSCQQIGLMDALKQGNYRAMDRDLAETPQEREAMMKQMLTELKIRGYQKTSLAVQKENYAVKMYKNVGFEIVDENVEEYIMVCVL